MSRAPARFVPPNVAAIESFFGDHVDREGEHLLVAEDERGQVVGYAFAIVRDRPDGAFLSARRTLSFEHLAVAESAWEIGVGGLLIRAVRQVARAVGASYIHLMVWNFNRHAIDVYEHADYRMRRHSTV